MYNVMIDIETGGTGPQAPILSIAAVPFDLNSGEIGPKFYAVIDLNSELALGAKPDGDTIYWLLSQSAEVREALTQKPENNAVVLKRLTSFIKKHSSKELDHVQVWGNGSTFDNTITRTAYQRCGLLPFWAFWNDCDVRTVVKAGRAIGFNPKKEMPFEGEKHHPVDDAIHQIKYLTAIWKRITAPRG
ncbi:3'-5' exonuclease [Serratia silvae]|uniref:3'-5' exoribonuclease n=1 Tax=Serratia silvae TaxID=2824122 RepID=A0ABT0KHT5_9GAMM|nr:3'-5' exonuclease [Serratia silvae]MCL1031342.1 3'-5' exoribonuclease [Serratia silvae]